MKLIRQVDVAPTILVNFHGVILIVPAKYYSGWLAMNKNGYVIAMRETPEYSIECDYWTCRNWGSNTTYIAEVQSDMKVKDSLIRIEEHRIEN